EYFFASSQRGEGGNTLIGPQCGERGKPIPWRVVGKVTNRMLPMTPIPTGKHVRTCFVSSDGIGKKQDTTFWSNSATAANTRTDTNAWAKSMNLILYLAAIAGGSGLVPSITHSPRNVASPYRTVPLPSRKLSVKLRTKQERPQMATRHSVISRFTAMQWPPSVKMGERSWKASTVPVGSSLARWAVLLKVWLMAFCTRVAWSSPAESGAKRGCFCCC
ncbi:unnamed protein product, partial [Musa banksii]